MQKRSVYEFNAAIVRLPGRSVINGLRAHDQGNPSFEAVLAEQQAYVTALTELGLTVTVLPALEDFPDSIFMEDPALVFAEGAIALRPGAPSRAGEVGHVLPELKQQFSTVMTLPGTGFADGGDVLVTPRSVMIGLSARTDLTGAQDPIKCLASLGYKGEVVRTPAGVLHFKTDCSLLDNETILATRRLAASGVFAGYRILFVPEGEEAAANALRVNSDVLVGAHFPRTIELLDQAGYRVRPLPTAEIGKIDAGLSCMSLRWFDLENGKRRAQAITTH